MYKLKLSMLAVIAVMATAAHAGPRAAPKAVAAPDKPAPFEPKFMRDETAARPVSLSICPTPPYPKTSLRNEETGLVTLQFKVSAQGVVLDGRVWRSSGFKDLDRSALSAMSACKFRPATINGEPVQGFTYLQYKFTLE